MEWGGRVGALILLGFIIVICCVGPAAASIDLFVDGRTVEARPALKLLGSGLGIAASLLGPEFGVHVDDTDFPVVELRHADRTVLLVVDDHKALIDGRPTDLASPPVVVDGTLFIPLTLIADLARLRVEWNLLTGALALERRTGAGNGDGVSAEAANVPYASDAHTPIGRASEAFEGVNGFGRRPLSASEAGTGLNPHASIGSSLLGVASGNDGGAAYSTPLGSVTGRGLSGPFGAQTRVTVTDVLIVRAGGHVQIEVHTDRAATANVMFLPTPARLVIDIDDAVTGTAWQALPGDGTIVEQVRAAATEQGGVRIVADLTAPTGYTLLPAETFTGFVVQLNNQLQLMEAVATDNGGVALHMYASGPLHYRTFHLREPERLVIDLFGVSVAGAEQLALPGQFATTFRLSQFEQNTVRGVFVLQEGVSAPIIDEDGRVEPGADGLVQLAFDSDGVTAVTPPPAAAPANGLDFVGFVRDEDLEFILLRAAEPLDVHVLRFDGPDRIVLDLPGTEVERSLGLITETSGIVKAVRAGQADATSGRVVAETNGVAEHHLLLSRDRTRAVLGLRASGLGGRTVVVDAGHGGRDPGAIGHSGTYEKDVTLAIALQVADLLERAGANVVLTRDRDVFLELSERAQLANELGADAFVSIHADAIGFGRIATGTSTFYHPENGNRPQTSVNRLYAQALQSELLKASGLPDRGIHEREFHVVLNTKMPSALVEVGFIDNPDEEKLLINPRFQARAAAGIVDGIGRFFAERAAATPAGMQQWQARTEQVTSAWLHNGVLPAGVTMLEPTSLLATAPTLEAIGAASAADLTAALLAALQERLARNLDF